MSEQRANSLEYEFVGVINLRGDDENKYYYFEVKPREGEKKSPPVSVDGFRKAVRERGIKPEEDNVILKTLTGKRGAPFFRYADFEKGKWHKIDKGDVESVERKPLEAVTESAEPAEPVRKRRQLKGRRLPAVAPPRLPPLAQTAEPAGESDDEEQEGLLNPRDLTVPREIQPRHANQSHPRLRGVRGEVVRLGRHLPATPPLPPSF